MRKQPASLLRTASPLGKQAGFCYDETVMTESPRPTHTEAGEPGRTTKEKSSISAPMLIFMTALDTTWRAFVPVLGGVFLGIAIDNWLAIAPIATIVCLILGTIASALLIAKQLRDVRKPLR